MPRHGGQRGNPVTFDARHIRGAGSARHGPPGGRRLIEVAALDLVHRLRHGYERRLHSSDCDTPEDYRRLHRAPRRGRPWTDPSLAPSLDAWPLTFGFLDDVRPALAAALAAGDCSAALATIVGLSGGGPRPVGTQMLLAGGEVTGFLSGGCLEADVAGHAQAVLASGEPVRLTYGEGSPWPDIRLMCGARIDILVERIAPDDPAAARLLGAGPGGVRTPGGLVGDRWLPARLRATRTTRPAPWAGRVSPKLYLAYDAATPRRCWARTLRPRLAVASLGLRRPAGRDDAGALEGPGRAAAVAERRL